MTLWSSRMPQSAERFRSLSKSKGRTVWFVLLRLSKNFVFRTVSRSKPRFRAKLKKNRALRAHFFFPCINSEIHAPGIYEFAKQIRLNACCRTKHKNKILLFRQASHPAFAGWFFVVKCVGGNWRNVTFIFHFQFSTLHFPLKRHLRYAEVSFLYIWR